MNEFVPRGYLTLEKALEHFGQLKHPDDWEAEKASSKRVFQQHLFTADLSADVLTDDGVLNSLRSSIWGSVEAERIFETGRAGISVGDEYFPDTVHGPVLIKQSSIDALFDSDSDDPSQSPDLQHEPQEDAEAPQPDVETKGSDNTVPVSDNETAQDRDEGGRPTYKKEIMEEGLYLLDHNEIDLAKPGKSDWHKVRKRVQKVRDRDQEQVDTGDVRGLSDQTIRRHLKPILNAHGKARG